MYCLKRKEENARWFAQDTFIWGRALPMVVHAGVVGAVRVPVPEHKLWLGIKKARNAHRFAQDTLTCDCGRRVTYTRWVHMSILFFPMEAAGEGYCRRV